MELRTKYEPGDYVWYMKNNKPVEGQIIRMRIFAGLENCSLYVRILYAFDAIAIDAGNERFYEESDLFSTKEELKKAIFG